MKYLLVAILGFFSLQILAEDVKQIEKPTISSVLQEYRCEADEHKKLSVHLDELQLQIKNGSQFVGITMDNDVLLVTRRGKKRY